MKEHGRADKEIEAEVKVVDTLEEIPEHYRRRNEFKNTRFKCDPCQEYQSARQVDDLKQSWPQFNPARLYGKLQAEMKEQGRQQNGSSLIKPEDSPVEGVEFPGVMKNIKNKGSQTDKVE